MEKPAAEVVAVGEGRRAGVRISPLARTMAKEHGIDISALNGTGPGGRIVKEDILRAIQHSKSTTEVVQPVERRVIPLTAMRNTIARRMSESFQRAPHFWLTVEVDVAELSKVCDKLLPSIEKESRERLTYTDLLVWIVARALEENPDVNATWTEEGVAILTEICIGLATSVEGVLIVPVIRQANKKSLSQITAARADLVRRGRGSKLTLDEMSSSTFTISNLGMFGIDQGNAIINPPESAILLVGRIAEKPVVENGQIAIRPRLNLTLSIDHRVLDGVSGSKFLMRIKELIENPIFMLR